MCPFLCTISSVESVRSAMSWVSGEQKLSRRMFCHRSSTGSQNVTTFRGVDAPVFSCSCCCSLLLLFLYVFVVFPVFVHGFWLFKSRKTFQHQSLSHRIRISRCRCLAMKNFCPWNWMPSLHPSLSVGMEDPMIEKFRRSEKSKKPWGCLAWKKGDFYYPGIFRHDNKPWQLPVVATLILFIVTPKIGEDSQFDSYFSKGLKPPTSCVWDFHFSWWGICEHVECVCMELKYSISKNQPFQEDGNEDSQIMLKHNFFLLLGLIDSSLYLYSMLCPLHLVHCLRWPQKSVSPEKRLQWYLVTQWLSEPGMPFFPVHSESYFLFLIEGIGTKKKYIYIHIYQLKHFCHLEFY